MPANSQEPIPTTTNIIEELRKEEIAKINMPLHYFAQDLYQKKVLGRANNNSTNIHGQIERLNNIVNDLKKSSTENEKTVDQNVKDLHGTVNA